MATVVDTRRRHNAGHFIDARGDMAVTHVARGKWRGRALLVAWGNGLTEDDAARFPPDVWLAREEGCTELLRVIARGV